MAFLKIKPEPSPRLIRLDDSLTELYRPASGKYFPAVFVKERAQADWTLRYPPAQRPWPYLLNYSAFQKRKNEQPWQKEIWERVRAFYSPERLRLFRKFPNHHYNMEKFVWAVGEDYAAQLISLNPALAYMLAQVNLFCGIKSHFTRTQRQLILKPWRELLVYMGFPNKASVAKVLSRINIQSLRRQMLFDLRAALNENDDLLKPLLALSGKISYGTLKIVLDPRFRSLLSLKALNESNQIQAEKKYENTKFILNDILGMKEFFRLSQGIASGLPVFQSMQSIRDCHDDLTLEINKIKSAEDHRELYPKYHHTVYKTEGLQIEQIISPYALQKEGKEQNNCIFKYHFQLLSPLNEYYVFKISKPERLTALIRIDSYSNPGIKEVRSYKNGRANSQSLALLRSYFGISTKQARFHSAYENDNGLF
jgi:hypothetical protein